MPESPHRKHVLIGSAGHIDHGKTRLIGRLTGIETDRLPEEKSRGISIDLGFAHWESDGLQFGVVDVPGHERFVKNMVAGATGVNMVLLVVAADDGVMPQTREHLEIMDLLGVRTGIVAVTKIDLVEPDFVELVIAEIEDLTKETFLEGCPIVPVSSETGAGIDVLRESIESIAADLEWPESQELFRMPIDRVFSIAGHGTIVTGSVLSGRVHAGDKLELLPDQREVRVRSVETHGLTAQEGGARRRMAVNLAGIKSHELSRGRELATQGYLRPTLRMLVRLRSLSSSPVVLKDRLEVNLHLGTTEIPARVILKGQPLKPGGWAYAELRVKQPIVATHSQPFILRRVSPAVTIAGGRILDPGIPPRKRIREFKAPGAALDSDSPLDRLDYLLSQQDSVDDSPLQAARRAGISPESYKHLLNELIKSGKLLTVGKSDRPLLVHRNRLERVSRSVLRTIGDEVARHQPRRSLPRNTLLTACREIARGELIEAVFKYLLHERKLVLVGANLGPADLQVKLTKNQQQTRAALLESIAAGGLTPPTSKELAESLGQKLDQIQTLLNLCVEDGLLVKVSEILFFSPEALEAGRKVCENLIKQAGKATMSQLREAWGVSRKFSVPLCEFFDVQGITVRNGDLRTAGPKISEQLFV